ncbi:hypothetical protein GCM10011344_11170 [Dokdonia pacifica]|uniref:Tetratricopeptide repeat-containing protein n=1 Tax=Dokdonia pacifica TaxID=1627892 RepID=A0A238YH85_9FLAO|nr:AraC family transcriptional regulator [Dokdonia pacifica]GGG12235.1 hypothetical protein GCM10011344_11170 [Dokdonia pacifica]SNR70616.1 Tetratricopeptide repeat-containing protein [Dokdonia pacifica]
MRLFIKVTIYVSAMYHKIFILSIFLFFTYSIEAQDRSTAIPDSTKAFISTSDSLREVVRFLNKTVREENDTVRAIAYQKLFLERGVVENDYKIQTYAAYRLGYYYNDLAEYRNAVSYTKTALEAATTIKDTTNIVKSNVLLGSIYFQLGIYDKSLEPYQEALRLSRIRDHKTNELLCLANISNIRIKLGRYQEALDVYTTTLTLLDNDDLKDSPVYNQTYLSTLLGKGKSQEELGYLDESLQTYEKGLELAKEYNLSNYNGDFYLNIGHVFSEKGQYQKAIDYLEKTKTLLEESYNDTYTNLLLANFYLSQCFYGIQEYDKAMELLQHNFELIGTNYKTDKILKMYDLGIKIAEIQGDKDLQLEFLNKSNLLNKLQLENQTKTRDLLFDNDVKALEDSNKQLDVEKTKQEFRKKVAIVIAAILFILFVVMYVLYKQKIKTNEKKFKAIIDSLQEVTSNDPTPIVVKRDEFSVKDHRVEEIMEKLKALEASNFFIELDCNLYTTAKRIDTNTTYLSKTLNTYKKQSFNQYLNELRIKYVLIQLKENTKFRAYTLKAISEEIGYKSINTFTKAFKTYTGLTPSYYIKQLTSENDQ